MNKPLEVNQRDYEKEVKVKCEKCDSQLLLLVHKNFKEKSYTLGCAECGHPNRINLSEAGERKKAFGERYLKNYRARFED